MSEDNTKKAEKAIEGEGSVVELKMCPRCGHMNPKGATQCPACARPLF